jgi:branched-chain amino acid transport system permease protein
MPVTEANNIDAGKIDAPVFGPLDMDERTRISVWSAITLFLGICGLLLIVSGFGLASDRLLKLGCVNVIAGLGIGLFCGGTGILSLGHVAFFGVGAYVSSWFTINSAIKPLLLPDMPEFILTAEWPLAAALVPAVLAATVMGIVTGFVMRRLRDTSAVIASFGFLVIAYLLFIGLKPLTNGKQSLYGLPTGSVTWPLVLGALILALFVAYSVKSSIVGRNAEAFREDEPAARSIGIVPARPIFLLWVVSAALMGLAGALFAHGVGIASPSAYYLEKTFALIVLIIVGGYRSLTGCVVGAVFVTFAEELFKNIEEHLGSFAGQEIAFGMIMPPVFGLTALSFSLMILLVLYYRPEGMAGYRELASAGWYQKLFHRWLTPKEFTAEVAQYRVPHDASLKTIDLCKSYGAFRAMENVNVEVRAGHITGLIGPNGAGKSTFINVITGNLFATDGKIMLNGKDATLWSAVRLAKSGLGRTFQNIRVFSSLTALENVIVSVNVAQPDLTRVQAENRAFSWLKTLGLSEQAPVLADGLAYGDQRRLEIARALALEPHFLLLDEPAAGMNANETQALTELLRDVVKRFGCGMLLVEHDLPMVMSLCDRIFVFNKGDQIASGTPSEVQSNPDVIEAYIGEETEEF